MEVFGDFSFVGSDNTTANPFQDSQVCINWYPEISQSKGSKTVVSLLGAPGLIQVAAAPGGGAPGFSPSMSAWPAPSSITNLPVRGSWVLPGRTQAIVVISNTCYVASIVTPGSSTTPGVLSLSAVGTLTTNSGPVDIRDNGVLGGVAVIVDNPNGYYYVFGAAGSAVGPVGTFTKITSASFLGASRVAEIDGWWIFSVPNSQTFFTNAAPYSTTFNASFFANKDSSSDLLMGVFESKEELWLPGETTTEIWYDAGGQYFPFQRLVGTELQIGCKAIYSIARMSSGGEDGLIWFGRSERGENGVIRTKGLNYEVVSTPAVTDAISQYTVTSDAIGYTYQEDTHSFYVLIFPTANRTWVYDASMPLELAWTQRLAYDPYAAQFHRHRSNCFMNFAGMRVVGDFQNGALYQLTRAAQNDAGWPLYARRRSPHIWNKENRERVHMQSLQVEFAPGQGAASGLGANPQAYLTIARDAGVSLGTPYDPAPSNTFPAPMGAIGNPFARTIWRKLGWSRDAVAQIDVIAPVNRDITGATLKAFGA